jgi:hypothetical protein
MFCFIVGHEVKFFYVKKISPTNFTLEKGVRITTVGSTFFILFMYGLWQYIAQ